MTLTRPLLLFAFIWAAIHLLFNHLKSKSLLPSHITLKGFHLRVQTTAYNIPHHALSSPSLSLARFLRRFYDVGSLVALIGMALALTLLVHNGATGITSLAHKLFIPSHPGTSIPHVNRRSLSVEEPEEAKSWIQPIIPGVTVPLTHLPIILSAVLIAQIVHETGHAIAAAIDALPILSSGLSLTLIIPSAFVSFSTTSLRSLSPRARARISAAGPFHNFLLWVLMSSVAYANLGGLVWSIGYRDVSSVGRVVVNVDSESSLYDYLSPGSLITGLDDTLLNDSHDAWDTYLLQTDKHHSQRPTLGWCTKLHGTDDTCCTAKDPKTSNLLSCFVSTDTPSTKGCLDPIPILASPPASTPGSPLPSTLTQNNGTITRCTSTFECSSGFVCAQPNAEEEYLRLTVYRRPLSLSGNGGGEKPEVIVWSGPREEVWEEIQTDTLLPRYPFIPLLLPSFAKMFWEYLLLSTLSLYLFNTLPLPYLDGSQFLDSATEMVFNSKSPSSNHTLTAPVDEYDLERQDRRSPWRLSRRRLWRKRVVGLVSRLTLGGLVVCVLVGVGNSAYG